MKFKSTLFFCILILSYGLNAQMNPNKGKQQEALRKLLVMAGEWEGTAIMNRGPGNQMTLDQKELVQFKLDSTIILVEGRGFDTAGVMVFNAMAVISYDGTADKYIMKSYTDMGMETDANFEVTETGFVWGFKVPQGGEVKYTAEMTETTWVEKGAFSQDGENWFDFIELNLTRKL